MEREEELTLEECVADINYEIAYLVKDLPKATHMVAASRRARLTTLRLEKLFRAFRKETCRLGLK